MKSNYIPLLTILFGSLLLNLALYLEIKSLLAIEPKQIPPTLIWNADNEALPADGQQVIIEQTINDTVYIGPIN